MPASRIVAAAVWGVFSYPTRGSSLGGVIPKWKGTKFRLLKSENGHDTKQYHIRVAETERKRYGRKLGLLKMGPSWNRTKFSRKNCKRGETKFIVWTTMFPVKFVYWPSPALAHIQQCLLNSNPIALNLIAYLFLQPHTFKPAGPEWLNWDFRWMGYHPASLRIVIYDRLISCEVTQNVDFVGSCFDTDEFSSLHKFRLQS